MEQFFLYWISHFGYIGVFFVLMLPIPAEALLAFSGYLACRGQLGLAATIVTAFLGTMCGMALCYWLGLRGGRYMVSRYGAMAGITGEKIERVSRRLDRPGRWGLIAGYFIPGIRHVAALAAGATRLRASVFAFFASVGALLWSAVFITAGYLLEEEWLGTSALAHRIVVAICITIAFILLIRYLTTPSKPGNT
ncbi:MAG: DedA family protein [Syntrophobacteraceae bacterium]